MQKFFAICYSNTETCWKYSFRIKSNRPIEMFSKTVKGSVCLKNSFDMAFHYAGIVESKDKLSTYDFREKIQIK